MSKIQQHKPFTKAEFEAALLKSSKFMEFIPEWYKTQWLQDNNGRYYPKRIKSMSEYGYIVPLTFNPDRVLKIYSSVKKRTNVSRDVGGDAIRIVLADRFGKPQHAAFTRINRTGNWEEKLRLRISEIICSIGYNTECPFCKGDLLLKWNHKDGSRFLGCSDWPKCKGKRPFNDGR